MSEERLAIVNIHWADLSVVVPRCPTHMDTCYHRGGGSIGICEHFESLFTREYRPYVVCRAEEEDSDTVGAVD